MAFFDEQTYSPFCVANALGQAQCSLGCFTGQTCEHTTIEDVVALHKTRSQIALIRRDGSACVIAQGGQKTVCARGRLFTESTDRDDWIAAEPVSLVNVISGYYDSLLLPNGLVCRLEPNEQSEFVCRRELVLTGGTGYEDYRRCLQESDRCLQTQTMPASERVVDTSVPFAVTADGALWGPIDFPDEREPTNSDASTIAPFAGFNRIVRLSASAHHLCGLEANGLITCSERSSPFITSGMRRHPHPMPPLGCVAELTSGKSHTCAQTCDNRTYCWGSNSDGQLAPLPAKVRQNELALTGVRQVSASDAHTCALRADGSVWCWGYPNDYPLGRSIQDQARAEPALVPLPAKATRIAGGDGSSCAFLVDGRVYCWGSNHGHVLVPNSAIEQPEPTEVPWAWGATQIAMGSWHSCALVEGRTICWGSNHLGQLGLGHSDAVTKAVEVPNVANAVDLDVGARACAAMANGRVKCWGHYPEPGLKNGGMVAVEVPNITDAVDVTVGDELACARNAKGAVWCGFTPMKDWDLRWPSDVQAVLAPVGSNSEGRCALMLDGTIHCFGDLAVEKQLKSEVEHLEGIVELALGTDHACALTRGGRVVCVGSDHVGQLGTGKLLVSGTPVLVP